MTRPLIEPAWRTRAACVCACAAVGFALLAVWVGGRRSTAFDDWVFRELYQHLGTGLAVTMISFSTPAVSVATCAVVVAIAALVRRWDVAVLAAIGPILVMALTEWVFKPALDRELAFGAFHVTGVFPSGHESAVASTACVLILVSFQVALSRRARAVTFGLVGLWVLVAALGLVRNFWHYPTDTLGSVLLATAVVLGLALVIDRVSATRRAEARVGGAQLVRRS